MDPSPCRTLRAFLRFPSVQSGYADYQVDLSGALQLQTQETYMRLAVEAINLPAAWYNVSASIGNSTIGVVSAGTTTPITVADGSYDVYSLAAAVQAALNPWGGTVIYQSLQNRFVFASGSITALVLPTAAAATLFGFGSAGTYNLSGGSIESTMPVFLTAITSVYLRSDIPRQEQTFDNIQNVDGLVASDVWASIPITNGPWNTQYWEVPNTDGTYTYTLAQRSVGVARFYLTDQAGNPLAVGADWSVVLRVEIYDGSDPAGDIRGLLQEIGQLVKLLWLSHPPQQGVKIMSPQVSYNGSS